MARSTKSACRPAGIRVVSAFQNRMSNGGRLLAEQVVVDPVVPDQVARAQPGEHLGERPAVEVAAARGLPPSPRRPIAAVADAPTARPARALSMHGDGEGEGGRAGPAGPVAAR